MTKYYHERRYLCLEDKTPSFIIYRADCGWVAYDTINVYDCSDENNWCVNFRTKKALLDYAFEGKKITCKKIQIIEAV